MKHVLKTVEPYFSAVESGIKNFEVRRNDRAYQAGDTLLLVDSEKCGCSNPRCDKRRTPIEKVVTFVYSGDPRFGGIEPGHVVLGLADPETGDSQGAS